MNVRKLSLLILGFALVIPSTSAPISEDGIKLATFAAFATAMGTAFPFIYQRAERYRHTRINELYNYDVPANGRRLGRFRSHLFSLGTAYTVGYGASTLAKKTLSAMYDNHNLAATGILLALMGTGVLMPRVAYGLKGDIEREELDRANLALELHRQQQGYVPDFENIDGDEQMPPAVVPGHGAAVQN